MNHFKTNELGSILAAANDGELSFEYSHTRLTHSKHVSEATMLLVRDLLMGYEYVNFKVDTVLLNNNLENDDYSATITLNFDDHGYSWNKEKEKDLLEMVSKNLKYHHLKFEED